jgi:hypothetical protein
MILLMLVTAVRHLLESAAAAESPDHETVSSKQNMPHHNCSSKQYAMSVLTSNFHQGSFPLTHSLDVGADLKNKYVKFTEMLDSISTQAHTYKPENCTFILLARNIKIMFLGSKVRLVRGADNLTAIYEPIV